jgi:hypothetical protein
MSFNRKYLDLKKLHHLFEKGEVEVEKFFVKADSVIYLDDFSSEVMNLWVSGKKEESKQKLKEHVSRITNETGRNC